MTNIIEKLARAAWEAESDEFNPWDSLDADEKANVSNVVHAVLQTLHDNITPEMVYIAEGYSDFIMPDGFDNSTEARRAEMKRAIQTAIATALKGERA